MIKIISLNRLICNITNNKRKYDKILKEIT